MKHLNLILSGKGFIYIPIKGLSEVSKLLKEVSYWRLNKTGISYEKRFSFRDNQRQKTLQKVRKSSKNRLEQETLIRAFA